MVKNTQSMAVLQGEGPTFWNIVPPENKNPSFAQTSKAILERPFHA